MISSSLPGRRASPTSSSRPRARAASAAEGVGVRVGVLSCIALSSKGTFWQPSAPSFRSRRSRVADVVPAAASFLFSIRRRFRIAAVAMKSSSLTSSSSRSTTARDCPFVTSRRTVGFDPVRGGGAFQSKISRFRIRSSSAFPAARLFLVPALRTTTSSPSSSSKSASTENPAIVSPSSAAPLE
jgi:hypothetical protein